MQKFKGQRTAKGYQIEEWRGVAKTRYNSRPKPTETPKHEAQSSTKERPTGIDKRKRGRIHITLFKGYFHPERLQVLRTPFPFLTSAQSHLRCSPPALAVTPSFPLQLSPVLFTPVLASTHPFRRRESQALGFPRGPTFSILFTLRLPLLLSFDSVPGNLTRDGSGFLLFLLLLLFPFRPSECVQPIFTITNLVPTSPPVFPRTSFPIAPWCRRAYAYIMINPTNCHGCIRYRSPRYVPRLLRLAFPTAIRDRV